jgi:hypothetical protein
MKIEGKITLGDILYVIFILFCLLSMTANSFIGWCYIMNIEFSIKQLILNLIVSIVTIFMFWMVFKYILVFKINRIK